MNKLLHIMSWITIISALSLGVLFIYWTAFPYKIADFEVPFEILNTDKTVKGGERLRYEMHYCKYTDEIPELTKFFIDGVIYEVPKTPGVAVKGCHVVVADVYVPKAIPPGVYTLKAVAVYRPNPIRKIEIVNYTEAFTVINNN